MSNQQKAHPTSEVVIVSYYRDYRACSLVRRLSNVIRQAGRQVGKQTKNPVLAIFKKIKYYIFNWLFWLVRLIMGTDSVQSVCLSTFCCETYFKMVFKGGIMAGASQNRGDPY